MLRSVEHEKRFKTSEPCLKVYSPVSNRISLERMYSPGSHFEKCFVYQKKGIVSADVLGLRLENFFSCSPQLNKSFFLLINIKMPTKVGNFIFISRENFMLR